MKKFYQSIGNNLAIGFEGDEREIERMYFSMWNLKATNGDFIKLSDNFGYVLTDKEKFFKYLQDSSERILYNQNQIEPTRDQIEDLSKNQYLEYKQEKFINNDYYKASEYEIGSIEEAQIQHSRSKGICYYISER